MRLVFLGTPPAAVVSLDALVQAGHDVALVITRPDTRRSRRGEDSPSPVKARAIELGLPVADSLAALDGVEVDLGVVVAYGALIPARALERTAMLNVHFSLLPRWRGAAPVERAILAGDVETGVCIMSLEASLDTGPVHAEVRTTVDEKTASALTLELAHLGAAALVNVLASPERLANPRAQVGEATYAAKLTTETFRLHPEASGETTARVLRLERAYCYVAGRRLRVVEGVLVTRHGAPGTISVDGDRLTLNVADAAIALVSVQQEGSRVMSAAQWWAGARLEPGVSWV